MNTTQQQQTVLVTGGSRGLGRDMAFRLAEKGHHVVITYLSNEAAAQEVVTGIQAAGGSAAAFVLDTRSTSQFAAFAHQLRQHLQGAGFAGLDYLVNNAGTALYAPVTEVSEEQMDDMYQIHYKGVFFLTQQLLPLMNEGGGIVNISSGLTRLTFPGSLVYGSMKAAVETLTRYLAKELGPRRIRANVVAPGAVETDFGGGRVRNSPELKQHLASITALGRVGQASDIGGIVAFLCTADAAWINAQRIEASGGTAL